MYTFFQILQQIAYESWLVLGEMAPYLLFGFLMSGVLSVCISPEWIERHLGGRGFMPVVKASLFGVPLPLCSCGVIPVSASIRRHGASRAAVISFLLSTPQTGVDSIAVTYALLGPVFAVFRPIAALITGMFGGGLVQLFGERDRQDAAPENDSEPQKPSCHGPCCDKKDSKNIVLRAITYGFVTLPRDIGASLVVGIVAAGAITALVPKDQWQPYLGGGLGAILLMMLLGGPIYVCATASVPFALGLMHSGASAGAAFAFLITGPATNPATIVTIWKLLGRRTAFLYLSTVALCAVGGGLLLDALFPRLRDSLPQIDHQLHHHAAEAGGWSAVGAVALLFVLIFSYFHVEKEEKFSRDRAPTDGRSGSA